MWGGIKEYFFKIKEIIFNPCLNLKFIFESAIKDTV